MLRALFCLLATASSSLAVSLHQLETFDSPTAWTSNPMNPNPPFIEANVGPLGFGDSALRITSSQGNDTDPIPGSKLVAYNTSDWTGNYSDQGIHTIEMDLRNIANLSISARIAIDGPGGWWVTPDQLVAPRLGWDSFSFELTDLVPANGPDSTDAAATLAQVTQIRILHNTAPSFRGATGLRGLRVDNIRAVPEPSTLTFLGLSLVFLGIRKR